MNEIHLSNQVSSGIKRSEKKKKIANSLDDFKQATRKTYLAAVKPNLDNTNKGDDLKDTRVRNSIKCSKPSLHISKWKTVCNIAGQSDTFKVESTRMSEVTRKALKKEKEYIPAEVTKWPRIASMEILPCLFSTHLSLSNLA